MFTLFTLFSTEIKGAAPAFAHEMHTRLHARRAMAAAGISRSSRPLGSLTEPYPDATEISRGDFAPIAMALVCFLPAYGGQPYRTPLALRPRCAPPPVVASAA